MAVSPERIGIWITIATSIVVGGMWVGSVSADVKNTTERVSKVEERVNPAKEDIAALKTSNAAIQRQLDDIKAAQDEILKELRKR